MASFDLVKRLKMEATKIRGNDVRELSLKMSLKYKFIDEIANFPNHTMNQHILTVRCPR